MIDFSLYTIAVLCIAFIWSGFVRAGLGFGGAGLMYPVALLAVDSVLFLVPIICVQLIFFASITLFKDFGKINWPVMKRAFLIILPPFMVGVFGLIQLPELWVLLTLYIIIIAYSCNYLLYSEKLTPKPWLDYPLLLVGGYVSGLSLSGAPLIAAIVIRQLDKKEIKASLFILWVVLCCIKLATLGYFEVDLQLEHQLWLLPCALVGHVLGNRFHDKILRLKPVILYRLIGSAMLILCLASLTPRVITMLAN